jgi:hypothetical protein
MLYDVTALSLVILDVKLDGLDPHSDSSSDCAKCHGPKGLWLDVSLKLLVQHKY